MGAGGGMKIHKIYHPPEQDAERDKVWRVAAYCRVSSKREEQNTSYHMQIAAYQQRIEQQPGWKLAGIYADYGKTGTKADGRTQFLQMVRDCEDGKIDIIITKSISRFARNTVDAVKYIRTLKEMGIRLVFEKEKIDTDDVHSEILLTVLAAFAQEESHSHSENVKWGKRKRAMGGNPPLYPPYGYRKSEDSLSMVIVPEEAEVVQWIFTAYEHGMSISTIVSELVARETPAPRIREKEAGVWEESRIWGMLNNVKYIGGIITQKRYTPDFMTGKERQNKGVLPQCYYEEHHEGIISKKQFKRCGDIMLMRSTTRESTLQYPYASLLLCPYCQKTLRMKKMRFDRMITLFCPIEKGCGDFVISKPLVDSAVLRAYANLDIEQIQVQMHCGERIYEDAASVLWKTKQNYPVFDSVEFWWLDDLIERILFGQFTCIPTVMNSSSQKHGFLHTDAKLYITWKCGLQQEVLVDVASITQNPGYRAKLRKNYALRCANGDPALAIEIRKEWEHRDKRIKDTGGCE